jgi:hypothetical protein
VAKEWESGTVKTGKAMIASSGAHEVARESADPVIIAAARSVGHTVATAHMADHSPRGALYALKAVKLAGKSIQEERDWQTKQLQKLPSMLVDLVIPVLNQKAKSLKVD